MPWRALSPKPGPQSPPSVELQFSTAEFHGNRYFWLLEAALLLLLLEPVDTAASHASLQERLSFAGRAESLETTVSPWAGVWWVMSLGGAEGPATLCPPRPGARVHFRLSVPLPAGCPGCAEEGVAPCGTLWHLVAPRGTRLPRGCPAPEAAASTAARRGPPRAAVGAGTASTTPDASPFPGQSIQNVLCVLGRGSAAPGRVFLFIAVLMEPRSGLLLTRSGLAQSCFTSACFLCVNIRLLDGGWIP